MASTLLGYRSVADSNPQLEVDRIVAEWESNKKVDLVLEGGGVKGIGLVGAYSVLEEKDYHPQNLAGTSAGAVVATLIAAGYTSQEIRDVIFHDLDLSRIADPIVPTDRIPFLGGRLSTSRPWNALLILRHRGLYKGDFFHQTLSKLLSEKKQKDVVTFGDLVVDPSIQDPRYRYKVQVIVSDLTDRALLRLPMDAEKLGSKPDDLPVADAVRMSVSIPFFFKPVVQSYNPSVPPHLCVDGGMLSNFPVWMFDAPPGQLPEWPTFGLKLVGPSEQSAPISVQLPIPLRASSNPGRLVNFLQDLVETALEAHDRMYLETAVFVRSIGIPTGHMDGTHFTLTNKDKEVLFEAGRNAADEFTRKWSYRDYLLAFRTDSRPGRRQMVEEYMQLQSTRVTA